MNDFQLIQKTVLDGLDIEIEQYVHQTTGMLHYHLASDHDENAFMIGFATQPMTSRGEAHILEHVVLCGSQKYPVRDPFFSMIKRSLNTFMNAMTASDWTVYPFATQNTKDYFNLLSVYLDAVFFPNLNALDFAQEGIRVEVDDEGKLCYHGIVFNEMKGAMSGEIEQLYYALMPHVFEQTTYHYNSGGDPRHIIDLTHADLVAFHQKHYHPSNAVMMSFGNIDAKQIQNTVIKEALMRFDGGKYPSKMPKIQPMTEMRRTTPKLIHDTYTSDVVSEDATHQVIAWLLPNISDPKMCLALRLMEGVLLEHSGLPLRAYLETTLLGQAPSPLLGLDDSHYEMVFYVGLRGSRQDVHKQLLSDVLTVLSEVASRPIDHEVIETILHQIELNKRHIGGGMPYGLTLMMAGFGRAIHGLDPVDIWQIDEHLRWLKEQLTKPMWLPNLIQTYLIDNPHRVQLVLSPDNQKSIKLQEQENLSLQAIAQKLSDDDIQRLKTNANELIKRQALVDDVDLLPKVTLADIPAQINFAHGDMQTVMIDGMAHCFYHYSASTHGLYYYQLVMTMDDEAILHHPLLPIYLTLISELGTQALSSRQFAALQAAHSSGISARVSVRSCIDDKNHSKSYFVLATHALNSKPLAVDILRQVLVDSVFTETERMSEILKQRSLSWQARLSSAGHAYAMQTASRAMNVLSANEYAYSGLPALLALKQFLAQNSANTDKGWAKLSDALLALHRQLMSLPKSVILVSEDEVKNHLTSAIMDSLRTLPSFDKQDVVMPCAFEPLLQLFETLQAHAVQGSLPNDLAWGISSNVYFNAKAYQAVTVNHADAPALMVLAPLMRNGYLHGAIREKGGAYGGGASFDGNSASFRFYSYRDPHFMETFAHFDKAIDWVINGAYSDELLDEAILGVIASMDKPASPAGEAIKSCFNDLHGRDEVWQNAMRAKILAVSMNDIKKVAKIYLKDKPAVRACLLPANQKSKAIEAGFEYLSIEKV